MNLHRLSESDLLALWARGSTEHALDRSLTALSAFTAASRGELADLPVGQRDVLLFDLFRTTFGRQIRALAHCPACNEGIELAAEVDQLSPPSAGSIAGELVVEADGIVIVCRQPSTRALAAAARAPSEKAARAALVAAVVVRATRDGEDLAVSALPPGVLARIEEGLGAMQPPAEILLSLVCPACGHGWSAPFDIGQMVWAAVDVAARRLMEVLAGLGERYGWSESESLAVPPERRRYYLERARA